jgi:5'-nucleotidase
VIDVLEEQWQPDGASRPFLKLGVAGLTYTYDPTAAAGAHVTQVMVGDTPLDPSATYRVIANSFLAAGGDNFTTLADGTDVTDTGQIDLQAFVAYMAEFSPVSPDLAQRAVGVHLVDAPSGGYLPRSTVTVDLSSLLMSDAGTPGKTVVLSDGKRPLGHFSIDPSIVDTTDEVGRATATFTVPKSAHDALTVTATVKGTGTSTSFTVPVAAVPACTVSYDPIRLGRWAYIGVVTVTNGNDSTLHNWRLTWDYTSGERALFGIGAKVRQRHEHVTAMPVWHHRSLTSGETATFAVVGNARTLGTPTGFALNGTACVVVTP